ncbi:Gfo/Idh/MocA family oxidoreductase [Fulvivirgaceae bacterium BMA10]|uniref:Gfo/Idh/MocA family oxidoreductase n=1 Tax=Splendidivirga corallicola TaxID=3051826 RepID=A0ABT8KSH1_9BACT|nr:Gfo/Idh/MocA family oxidoreductase [Fulvivirgaceae bacterium BMA10]
MESRRSCIEKISKGVALAALGFSPDTSLFTGLTSKVNKSSENISIGIIGAENSHTRAFGKLFNIDKKFPGVEVKYVWGETEAFAKNAMEKGGIPSMVKDPKEMLGKIDALIVDHRHGKFHLEAATPFVKAGVPTFIDKPFCYRVEEGKKFLGMARELGTPITSYSSVAHSYATLDIKDQVSRIEDIKQVVSYGPLDMNSPYGGVFFYGPHLVQPLLYIFGNTVTRVRVNKNNKNSSASLVFKNGMLATLIFTTKRYGWQTFVETEQGIIELKSSVEDKVPSKNYVDMVTMFKTGQEPRSHQSILHGVAVLEALEKSVLSEQWETVAL